MERNEISYQFSGCKVSLAWFSKAQESLDYSFTQLRNSYVYSIISTVGMIIGRFERLVAKLIEISLERKKEEGKKGGEREREETSVPEFRSLGGASLQRFADSRKNAQIFHEQHFLPASLLWNRVSLHFITEKFAFEIGDAQNACHTHRYEAF